MLPAGRCLGPYQIVSLIGAGGMGEVYRARDSRLGRDVALKVIRDDRISRDGLQRFEREARAAASLSHHNILTVHDVGSADGTAYVVTELLEGETLRGVLSLRSPGRQEALRYAIQAAQGLAAAHDKGIVHRDLKPENLFLTRDGRVKILDFGLAETAAALGREGDTAEHSTDRTELLGTVEYMSPEQVKAQALDARSDIFSLGVVLYELLSHRHPFRRETVAATLSAILWEPAPALSTPETTVPPALDAIVRRCLEKDRQQRFQGAHDLALALEALAGLGPGAASGGLAAERNPYPGLAAFTEDDVAFFFGRDVEVAAVWRRLESRRLLAVIGPSGAGKTSFLRAGVVPARPGGWGALVTTPGATPMRNLGRALAPELSGDPDAVRRLLDFGEGDTAAGLLARWRQAHSEALLVVDQFEELFTLNPRETQRSFASLLGRLAKRADLHVLLSLRDDYLMRCSGHEALAPVFESLTPLATLGRDGLTEALVEPAARLGYRFEEGLVDEMLQAVSGSRGALPLLAFAVARLWELRDRERALLTRTAYRDTGGVAGALAQHAEAVLERIGPERQAIVREILRNLVTAEGTRAAVEREDLLSLFPLQTQAAAVLDTLIEARLLTSYVLAGVEGPPSSHRIEVVHESLLGAWPRLARWRTQDEQGAVLRDQLKQAARLWQEKGRTKDLLWTGTAYREYELWRERYPGALTALEQDFARAMTEKARRRRRAWTGVVAALVLAGAVVVVAIGISRQQATLARDQARAEALRAEAGKLLALGRSEIDRYPAVALAHVRKSLELADTSEARRLAVEILWRGPLPRVLPLERVARELGIPHKTFFGQVAVSPDGRWLAARSQGGHVLLFQADGGTPRSRPGLPGVSPGILAFDPRSERLVSGGPSHTLSVLSLPDLRELRRLDLGDAQPWGHLEDGRLVTWTQAKGRPPFTIRVRPFDGGEAQTLATSPRWWSDIDGAGRRIVSGRGRSLFLSTLGARERVLAPLSDNFVTAAFLHGGDSLASVDAKGEVRLWSGQRGSWRVLAPPTGSSRPILAVSRGGSRLAAYGPRASVDVWDFRDPPDVEPLHLLRPEPFQDLTAAFAADGRWLVTDTQFALAFWPFAGPWMRTLRRLGTLTMSLLAFSPDSRWLASCGLEPTGARLWPLRPEDGTVRVLESSGPCTALRFHPGSEQLLVGTAQGDVRLLSLLARPDVRRFQTHWEGAVSNGTCAVAFDSSGRRAAASPFDMNPSIRDPRLRALRVFDLASGRGRTYPLAHLTDAFWWGFDQLRFAPDGSLLAGGAGAGGVSRLVLPANDSGAVSGEILYQAGASVFDLSADGRYLVVAASRTPAAERMEELLVLALADHRQWRITSHGQRIWSVAIAPSGRAIVTGDIDGAVRVGPATGEEPHLLLGGHGGVVWSVAVSPDERWIASVGDEAIHLWPMPDLAEPPLHTLPREALLVRLDALTNLRVVADPASASGWRTEVGPFAGWSSLR